MKKYYRVKCIERNKEYYGSTFWDAGYHYEYTPVSEGHKFMFDLLDKFNDVNKNKINKVHIDIVRIFGKQQSVLKIKGCRRLCNEFITTLLLSDFSNHFTFTECPYWDINHEDLI